MEPEALTRLIISIAEALGCAARFGSKVNHFENPNLLYIIRAGTAERICIRESSSERGKLVIDGEYPRTDAGDFISPPYGESYPKIRVNPERGAKVIAKDIERRLLPEYRKYLAYVLDRKKQADEYMSVQKRNVQEMLQLLDGAGTLNQRDPHAVDGRFSLGHDREYYGDAFVSDYTVEFHIRSMSLARARKIAAILAEK